MERYENQEDPLEVLMQHDSCNSSLCNKWLCLNLWVWIYTLSYCETGPAESRNLENSIERFWEVHECWITAVTNKNSASMISVMGGHKSHLKAGMTSMICLSFSFELREKCSPPRWARANCFLAYAHTCLVL